MSRFLTESGEIDDAKIDAVTEAFWDHLVKIGGATAGSVSMKLHIRTFYLSEAIKEEAEFHRQRRAEAADEGEVYDYETECKIAESVDARAEAREALGS